MLEEMGETCAPPQEAHAQREVALLLRLDARAEVGAQRLGPRRERRVVLVPAAPQLPHLLSSSLHAQAKAGRAHAHGEQRGEHARQPPERAPNLRAGRRREPALGGNGRHAQARPGTACAQARAREVDASER
jgi:hypothetical protein